MSDVPLSGSPAIILVQPTLGENIGAAARAMMNFGLSDMRLVNPRGGWPNQQAINTSSGAERILEQARLFDSTEAAVADLQRLYATTARMRDLEKPVLAPPVSCADTGGTANAPEFCSDARRWGFITTISPSRMPWS